MMLTNISGRNPQDAPASSTPLEMLQGCHVRIRHFMQLSRTLSQALDAPQAEIAEAAAALVRYFSQALPLHEADENETLFPRLHLSLASRLAAARGRQSHGRAAPGHR